MVADNGQKEGKEDIGRRRGEEESYKKERAEGARGGNVTENEEEESDGRDADRARREKEDD